MVRPEVWEGSSFVKGNREEVEGYKTKEDSLGGFSENRRHCFSHRTYKGPVTGDKSGRVNITFENPLNCPPTPSSLLRAWCKPLLSYTCADCSRRPCLWTQRVSLLFSMIFPELSSLWASGATSLVKRALPEKITAIVGSWLDLWGWRNAMDATLGSALGSCLPLSSSFLPLPSTWHSHRQARPDRLLARPVPASQSSPRTPISSQEGL